MPGSNTTGGVITIYWSGMGNPARRKTQWGNKASKSLGGKKLAGDTWTFDSRFNYTEIRKILDKILGQSDKAIILFPHGTTSGGAAQMSIHRYNC